MTAAIFGLVGVLVGSVLSGILSSWAENVRRAYEAKEAVIARLERLGLAVRDVDAAVQSWSAYGKLSQVASERAEPEAPRLLEEAGKAAGAVATSCIPLLVLRHDLDDRRSLADSAQGFAECAKATTRELPGRGFLADSAYPGVRDVLVTAIGADMAAVRAATIPWWDRAKGRFNAPL